MCTIFVYQLKIKRDINLKKIMALFLLLLTLEYLIKVFKLSSKYVNIKSFIIYQYNSIGETC
jgi:hypothetical protein